MGEGDSPVPHPLGLAHPQDPDHPPWTEDLLLIKENEQIRIDELM